MQFQRILMDQAISSHELFSSNFTAVIVARFKKYHVNNTVVSVQNSLIQIQRDHVQEFSITLCDPIFWWVSTRRLVDTRRYNGEESNNSWKNREMVESPTLQDKK